jgi:hypothetical protein
MLIKLKLEFQIWVAGVDKELSARGIIVPGLGDAVSVQIPCVPSYLTQKPGRSDV